MQLSGRNHQSLQIHRAGKNKLDTFTGKLAIFTVDIENPLPHLQGICCWISIREIARIQVMRKSVMNRNFGLQHIVIGQTERSDRAVNVGNGERRLGATAIG